jgi:Amt family ammonium transporter
MRRRILPVAGLAAGLSLAAPTAALADSLDAAENGVLGDTVAINTLWVVIAAVFVLLMLAGLLCLEAGMSRMKNVGTLVPKALISMAVAGMMYYACGFAFAFGNGDIIGSAGFFLRDYGDPQKAFGIMGLSDALIESKWLFQFAFCAVTLAIVWGSTLERIKFGAHALFAVVFAGFIYPLVSHWVFGGGWLQANVGMQDFAGSTAVHLVGATAALAGLLLLGPRRGKYNVDGTPRPIPGHSMYILGLGMFILLFGWFGFNAGSTLGVADGRFAEVAMVTALGACGGILGAYAATSVVQRTVDIGMVCNGLVAGLVAITAPSGYVENWAAPIIGIVGGLLVVPAIMLIDKKLDDPVGVLSAPRPRRHLGHPGLRLLHRAALRAVQRGRRPRRWARVLRLVHAAGRPGAGHRGRLRDGAHAVRRDLLRDQEDRGTASHGRAGAGRPRHLRARHVRLSRAVHPRRGALREHRPGVDQAQRARAGDGRVR